jgi:hypothetical protein
MAYEDTRLVWDAAGLVDDDEKPVWHVDSTELKVVLLVAHIGNRKSGETTWEQNGRRQGWTTRRMAQRCRLSHYGFRRVLARVVEDEWVQVVKPPAGRSFGSYRLNREKLVRLCEQHGCSQPRAVVSNVGAACEQPGCGVVSNAGAAHKGSNQVSQPGRSTTRAARAAGYDWFEECKRLHGRTCNGRYGHWERMKIDELRAEENRRQEGELVIRSCPDGCGRVQEGRMAGGRAVYPECSCQADRRARA